MVNSKKQIDLELVYEAALLTDNYAIYNAFCEIPKHFFKLSPRELKSKANPTQIESDLVPKFIANLFKVAVASDKKAFKTKNLVRRICSYNHFYYRILDNPFKCLWLLYSVTVSVSIVHEFMPIYEEHFGRLGMNKVATLTVRPSDLPRQLRIQRLLENILQA